MRVAQYFGRATVLLALVAAGCGDDGANPSPSATTPAGGSAKASDIIVDGSSTVYRISVAAQEDYEAVAPSVRVVVDSHGTGGGFGRYLRDEVDIVDASRAAKPDEEASAKAQGIDWTRFLVGYDGITVVVNPKNTFIKSLTADQLKKIWAADSTVKTWKDVDPSWPDRKIIFYCPDKDSGTFEFFTEAINGKAKSQRNDTQPSSDDNTLVTGVAGDPDGLGYFGYAYFAANKDKLRAIPVQKGEGKPVMPSPETILDKSYAPLSRPLFIYVKNRSLRQRPEVAAFVKFYVENVGALSEKGGYVSPTAEDKAANAKTLADATAPSK